MKTIEECESYDLDRNRSDAKNQRKTNHIQRRAEAEHSYKKEEFEIWQSEKLKTSWSKFLKIYWDSHHVAISRLKQHLYWFAVIYVFIPLASHQKKNQAQQPT